MHVTDNTGFREDVDGGQPRGKTCGISASAERGCVNCPSSFSCRHMPRPGGALGVCSGVRVSQQQHFTTAEMGGRADICEHVCGTVRARSRHAHERALATHMGHVTRECVWYDSTPVKLTDKHTKQYRVAIDSQMAQLSRKATYA